MHGSTVLTRVHITNGISISPAVLAGLSSSPTCPTHRYLTHEQTDMDHKISMTIRATSYAMHVMWPNNKVIARRDDMPPPRRSRRIYVRARTDLVCTALVAWPMRYADMSCICYVSPYSHTYCHTYYYWYSITHSLFYSWLKSFLFCKSSLPQPFLFLLQDSLYGFPRLFTVTSEHIRLFTF